MNLQGSKLKAVLNTVDANTLQVITEGGVTVGMFVKDMGIEIYNGNAVNKIYAPKAPMQQCSDIGVRRCALITINPTEPASLVNYSYGIRLMHRHKLPGTNNPYNDTEGLPYTGKFNIVSATGGYLDTQYKRAIENDLIGQIHDARRRRTFDGSPAEAVSAEKMLWVSNATGITLTDQDGNTTTIAGQVSAAALIAAINAQTTVSAKAVLTGVSNQIMVFGNTNGTRITITYAGAGVTFVGRYIMLTSTVDEQGYASYNFNVDIDSDLGSVEGIEFIKLGSSNSYSGNHNITFENNGTSVPVTYAGGNVTAFGAAISAALGTTNAITTVDATGEYVYVLGTATTTSLQITQVPAASYVTKELYCSPEGGFPKMTWDDIYFKFSNTRYGGAAVLHVHTNQVIAGMEYCKYTFKQSQKNDVIIDEGATNTHTGNIVIYVPKTYAESANWNGILNTVFGSMTGWTTWLT